MNSKTAPLLSALLITSFGLISLSASETIHGWKDNWGTHWTTHLEEDFIINPFIVSEGTLTIRGEPFGYIRTRAVYHQYELEFEWRWVDQAGNSGVLLHINGPDQVWPLCIESQLRAGNAGDIVMINTGSGVTVRGESYLVNGDARFAAAPKTIPDIEKPVGEWNHCRIVNRGSSLEVFVNGELVNAATSTTLSSGFIGFQSEGAPIQIRELALTPMEL